MNGNGGQPISFTVLGRPQPAGSKTAFVNPKTGKAIVTDASRKSKPWKQEVAGQAREAMGDGELLEGPLRLDVAFFIARPKGHYGSGSRSHLVKDSAPAYPATRPDATKLVRAVEDALTGIAWRDDAQVVVQVVTKAYGVPERCEVAVAQPGLDLLRRAAA